MEQVVIHGVKSYEELKNILEGSCRTELLNPADRECSPEVYSRPREARLANIIKDFLLSIKECDISFRDYNDED